MDVSFDALVPPGSFRTTFKTLKGVGPNLQFASTLGFKERVALQRASPAEYSKMYSNQMSTGNVTTRLYNDAIIRRSVPKNEFVPNPPPKGEPKSSGYSRNNTYVPMQSLRAAQAAAAPEPPVETLHPISFRRFAHTHPIDFYAAIRPDTQTTNQTLRMMGVYDSDYFFVKKMGVHIPHASGLRKFHPDVSLAASKRFM